MVLSEMIVWSIAITVNLISILYFPEYYDTTALTKVFHIILITPYPYWGVILLSVIGTFMSICFGDEMMDIASHSERSFFHKHGYKHELIVTVAIFAIIIIGYYELIASLGIDEIIKANK